MRGTFHAKMGTIKDRNGMELTEAEDIKKRWQECTEELYKKHSETMAGEGICHMISLIRVTSEVSVYTCILLSEKRQLLRARQYH